jgi:hypothetical protein
MIEMLIVEGLVSGRDGWSDAVKERRARFHRIQLMARSDEILKQLVRSWRGRM